MNLDYAALSLCGRRKNNEDSLCAEPTLGLYAVADGMGGYEGGEVASRVTVETLAEFLRRNAADDDVTWPFGYDTSLGADENLVHVAVRFAHREVAVRRVGPLAKMGSTVALLVCRSGRAIIGHVGDSRVYRLRAGRLEQLTRDHSVYAEMQAAGVPDLPPREQCSFANMITRALGLEEEPRADLRLEPLEDGDVYLLCTDGLTEKLNDEALAAHLRQPSADAACRALVDGAYAAGGRDNITAVVVRVRHTLS
jgi:serine/threonine protein phosphatase PrpC